MRTFFYIFSIWLATSCSSSPTAEPASDAFPLESDCGFQLQSVSSMPETKHKVVSGLRTCNGQTSSEIMVYAPHESIDNSKACNLFATNDTATTWQIELSHNHIIVIFLRQPSKANILMQQETVYDSVKVSYTTNSKPQI